MAVARRKPLEITSVGDFNSAGIGAIKITRGKIIGLAAALSLAGVAWAWNSYKESWSDMVHDLRHGEPTVNYPSPKQ